MKWCHRLWCFYFFPHSLFLILREPKMNKKNLTTIFPLLTLPKHTRVSATCLLLLFYILCRSFGKWKSRKNFMNTSENHIIFLYGYTAQLRLTNRQYLIQTLTTDFLLSRNSFIHLIFLFPNHVKAIKNRIRREKKLFTFHVDGVT